MSEPIAIVRASSWPELFDCSLRWAAKNLMGIRSPSSGAAQMGTAIHAGTAMFDTRLMQGQQGHSEEAVEATLQALRNPQGEVDWGEDSATEAEGVAIKLTASYCFEVAPHVEHAAVELACEALDVATEHGVVRLTGTTDRIRRHADGSLGIRDLKSGQRAVGADGKAVTKGHHLQTGVYRLMAEHATGQTMSAASEIVGLQTTAKTRIGVGVIADDRTPLVGTDEQPGLIQMAAQMLKGGLFPPNPKSNLCSAKYCPFHSRCAYHD